MVSFMKPSGMLCPIFSRLARGLELRYSHLDEGEARGELEAVEELTGKRAFLYR
jgi:hypothetical protein